jgi:hypothetical protein
MLTEDKKRTLVQKNIITKNVIHANKHTMGANFTNKMNIIDNWFDMLEEESAMIQM